MCLIYQKFEKFQTNPDLPKERLNEIGFMHYHKYLKNSLVIYNQYCNLVTRYQFTKT